MYLSKSMVLTEHMFENLHVLYDFKVDYVKNFTMINEKNDSSFQEHNIITL